MTHEKYKEITHEIGWFNLPYFEFEEVQNFLNSLGYELVEHDARAIVKIRQYNMGGECESSTPVESFATRVLAMLPTDKLPERNDSDEAIALDIRTVFTKEIKKKLLGI